MRNYDLSPLLRQWIGFDKLASALQTAGESQSFPPYNIEKSDDNHYRITLALAGFRQEDLDIQLEGTRLVVKGTPQQPEKETTWPAPGVGEPGLQPELHPRRQHGGLWRDLHQWPAAYRSDPQ
ncbi:16 kDa heat shock protein B [Klebsiella pneumoniae]|nr:16 kDa heat shock protein B [Klebsiella pneumoniae]